VKTLINYYNLINFWVFRKSHVNSSIPSLSCFVFMKSNFNPISVVISRKSHCNSTNVLLFPGKGMDEKIKDWREFSAGFISGYVNVLVLYPIHKLIFRQVWKSVSEIFIRFLQFSFIFCSVSFKTSRKVLIMISQRPSTVLRKKIQGKSLK